MPWLYLCLLSLNEIWYHIPNVRQNFACLSFCSWDSTLAFESCTNFLRSLYTCTEFELFILLSFTLGRHTVWFVFYIKRLCVQFGGTCTRNCVRGQSVQWCRWQDEGWNFQDTGQAAFACVRQVKLGKQYHYKIDCWTPILTLILYFLFPLGLTEFIFDSFKEVDINAFCNEYKQDHVHTMLWCHPCYQSEGPMYDWMINDFGVLGKFPCPLALVDWPQDPDKKYQLVVQSTIEEIKEHEPTLLRERKWLYGLQRTALCLATLLWTPPACNFHLIQ
jgi:hypothetical protein